MHVLIALPERTYANDCVVVEIPPADRVMINLKPLLEDRRFTDGLVLILTFDEDDSGKSSNGNRVFTAIWGGHVKIGTSSDVYDHEDLLATISALLGIEPPPFDEKGVRPMGGIWK